MPNAICLHCRTVVRFHNHRGDRKPETCTACGGPMSLARAIFEYDDDKKYVVITRFEPVQRSDSGAQKRRAVTCYLCGDKRMYPSRNVTLVEHSTEYGNRRWGSYGYYFDPVSIVTVPAGKFVCWHHDPVDH